MTKIKTFIHQNERMIRLDDLVAFLNNQKLISEVNWKAYEAEAKQSHKNGNDDYRYQMIESIKSESEFSAFSLILDSIEHS
jgi:hypothetical protein